MTLNSPRQIKMYFDVNISESQNLPFYEKAAMVYCLPLIRAGRRIDWLMTEQNEQSGCRLTPVHQEVCVCVNSVRCFDHNINPLPILRN